MIKSNVKKTIADKIFFCIIFLIIFCSQDTVLFGTNINMNVITFAKYLPFIFIPIIISMRPKFTLSKLLLPFVMVVLLMVSCLVNGEEYNNYFYRCAIVIVASLVVTYDVEKFWEYFAKIIDFLCIISVIIFIINIIAPEIVNLLPVIHNSIGMEFHTIGLASIDSDFRYYGIARNSSIFREQGIFVAFITIALINYVKRKNILNDKRLMLYIITMLTTMSTAGYIILILFGIYLITSLKKNNKKTTAVVLLSLVLIIGFMTLSQSGNLIWGKFIEGTNSYGSWFSRLSSVFSNIEIASENPFFGIGRYKLYETMLAVEGIYMANSNTNTILICFSAFGIMYGIINLLGITRFIFDISIQNMLSKGILFLILISALSNEDLGQNIVYYVIVFEGLYGSHNICDKDRLKTSF